MLRKPLLAVIALALLIAATLFFGPHWTVNRMRAAIDARDYEAFSSHVDYPALRESFKEQLAREPGKARGEGQDPFAALGEGLARAVTGPLIDLLLGPAALIEMINAGRPEVTRAVMSASVAKVPSAPVARPEMTVRYRDWNTAVYRKAEATDADGGFILRRQGWWGWKLAAVELPS